MPGQDSRTAAPIEVVVQRGTYVYTRDHAAQTADDLNLICEAPTEDGASWVAWSLAQAHGVPHKVEPADKAGPKAKVEITGFVQDPAFRQLISYLGQADEADNHKSVLDELQRRTAAGEVLNSNPFAAREKQATDYSKTGRYG